MTHTGTRLATIALAAALALAACTPPPETAATSTAPPAEHTTTESAQPAAAAASESAPAPAQLRLKNVRIKLQKVAGGFSRPVLVTSRPGDDRLYVVEQGGRLKSINPDGTGVATVLNLSDEAGAGGNERGLLGIAFDPADPSRLFVNYTGGSGNTNVVEYSFPIDADAASPDPVQTILTQNQPYSNHNGGMMAFGPEGYLYIGFGDGGGSGDPGGRAQQPTGFLGSMLRIDVSAATGYAIPPDNPFADGEDGAPEVWAYGLRNPWRWSFDGDDMYIGDVGQYRYEEIDVVNATTAAGANFGWNVMEGKTCYKTGKKCSSKKRGFVAPVATYKQVSGRCSVTGGYVAHDAENPTLEGTYFYGDYCTGQIYGLRMVDGVRTAKRLIKDTDKRISSFGRDNNGAVYVVDLESGSIYRIVEK